MLHALIGGKSQTNTSMVATDIVGKNIYCIEWGKYDVSKVIELLFDDEFGLSNIQ